MYIYNHPFLPSYIGSGVGISFLPNCSSQYLQKIQHKFIKISFNACTIDVCVQLAMNSCVSVCACVHACVCVCVCMCACMHVHVCMWACMCVREYTSCWEPGMSLTLYSELNTASFVFSSRYLSRKCLFCSSVYLKRHPKRFKPHSNSTQYLALVGLPNASSLCVDEYIFPIVASIAILST